MEHKNKKVYAAFIRYISYSSKAEEVTSIAFKVILRLEEKK